MQSLQLGVPSGARRALRRHHDEREVLVVLYDCREAVSLDDAQVIAAFPRAVQKEDDGPPARFVAAG